VSSIHRADLKALSDAELEPHYALERACSLDTWPEDGFIDFNTWATWLRGQPPEHRVTALSVDAPELRAAARVGWEDVPENRHLAYVDLMVEPSTRRQGLGRRLLAAAAEVAAADGRTLLTSGTSSRTPAGEGFARAVGAYLGLVEHENRLVLGEVDRELLREWLRPAPGYRTLQIDGPNPPELIEEAAAIVEVMNDAPRGELQEEDFRARPELMQQRDHALAAAGFHVWTVFAQHEASGRLVGFTRLSGHPSKPRVIEQWGTGVAREHRGHGLGRLLKATNLQRVLTELPDAREVLTTNADSNEWMLAINHALGFRRVADWQHWQVEAASAVGYTSRQSARPLE
jgi:mycothiol synthase